MISQTPLVACSWSYPLPLHCLSLKHVWRCGDTEQGQNLWAGEKWERTRRSASRGRKRSAEEKQRAQRSIMAQNKKKNVYMMNVYWLLSAPFKMYLCKGLRCSWREFQFWKESRDKQGRSGRQSIKELNRLMNNPSHLTQTQQHKNTELKPKHASIFRGNDCYDYNLTN